MTAGGRSGIRAHGGSAPGVDLGLELTAHGISRRVSSRAVSDRRSSWTLPLDGSAILQGEGVRHSPDWHRPRKTSDATMSEFQPSALQCARSVLPALRRDRERPTESHSVRRHASRHQAARPVSLLLRLRRETHHARGLAQSTRTHGMSRELGGASNFLRRLSSADPRLISPRDNSGKPWPPVFARQLLRLSAEVPITRSERRCDRSRCPGSSCHRRPALA